MRGSPGHMAHAQTSVSRQLQEAGTLRRGRGGAGRCHYRCHLGWGHHSKQDVTSDQDTTPEALPWMGMSLPRGCHPPWGCHHRQDITPEGPPPSMGLMSHSMGPLPSTVPSPQMGPSPSTEPSAQLGSHPQGFCPPWGHHPSWGHPLPPLLPPPLSTPSTWCLFFFFSFKFWGLMIFFFHLLHPF